MKTFTYTIKDELGIHARPAGMLVKEVKKLIPRIIVMAIPETLNYLLRGGRLSKPAWLVGSILKIKPIIGFVEGKVKSLAKTRSLKSGMEHIVNALKERRDLTSFFFFEVMV